MRVSTFVSMSAAGLVLAACGVEVKSGGSGADSSASPAAGDSAGAAPATATTGGDSTTAAGGAAAGSRVTGDTATLEVWPERPKRGGVVWARLRDTGEGSPRCTWNGAPLTCHADGGDALVVVPLPADAPAGIFALGVEAGGRRATRSIEVQDQKYDRELVFLDTALYALTQDSRAIARDARAVRSVLAGESAERRWGREAWREPKGARGTGYGVERFYYRASDSRSIRVPPDAHASGSFGADTSSAARPAGSAPSWRHAGVDLGLKRGTPVTAPAGATVADVGRYQLTGNTLLLDHGQGVFTAYFHLDTVLVRRGDVVRAGQALGRVGSTGLSTGPHLHFGVYVHGQDVDPAAWKEMPPWLSPTADSARMASRRGG
jgi:murein DD-endopeptidase MepM/ murein hydrolase activator NlpD